MGKLSNIWSKRVNNEAHETPEKIVLRSVKRFCTSGGQGNAEEEVLHLPAIVDAAEASPKAAGVAAAEIQHFLTLDYDRQASSQYNAIMLIRILSDNPGPTFTVHMAKEFTQTVKDLLRRHRDPSIQQFLRETLDSLEVEKSTDGNLGLILSMWRHEKQKIPRGSRTTMHQPESTQLPPPHELAGRIEEARNSAKLLVQLSQTTSPWDFADNDLLKEFYTRSQSAQRSLQGYMNCIPPPDEATFQTFIETSELISVAITKYQRAALAAQRQTATINNGPQGLGVAPPNVVPAPVPNRIQETYIQQPLRPTASPAAYNPQLQPITSHNPFDDANQIPPRPLNPYPSSAQTNDPYYGSSSIEVQSPRSPPTGAIELPLSRTPPPMVRPPIAPVELASPISPPRRNFPMQHPEYEEDLYSAAPPRPPGATQQRYPAHPNNYSAASPPPVPRSRPQELAAPPRQELQGTPSYYHRQDVATQEIVMSGAATPPPESHAHPQASPMDTTSSPGIGAFGERKTASGRVRDDDPVPPVGERGGWRNWN